VSSSISRRLVLWLAVPLMLLALCGALVHYFNNVAPGVISSDRRLKDATNAVLAHSQTQAGVISLDARPALPPLPAPDSVIYAIRDSKGRLLAGTESLPNVSLGEKTGQLIAMIRVDYRTVRSLITRFDTPAGMVLLTVADLRPAAEPAARYGFMSTLLWDFVQLDITLVLVWVGIQLGLRPVRRLREEIASRSPQDLRPIDESTVPREIAPVVITLNRLFGTLRASAQSQQQFIANTAHQLRTPLTGLQAQLDLLVAEPAATPVTNRLHTLQEGIRQLARTANQLLSLARADPGANMVNKRQLVRLDGIAGEVAARYFDRALQCNLDLGIDVQALSAVADSSLLDDLTSNLVDNALSYTAPGGAVTISVGASNGRAFIAVEDTGPGIPEAERLHVLQRFYRLPNSSAPGSGLGLAIVHEIAQLHGATLSISAGAQGKGTRVQVLFPP
jgi:two-component system sensor histidine kinase TctE